MRAGFMGSTFVENQRLNIYYIVSTARNDSMEIFLKRIKGTRRGKIIARVDGAFTSISIHREALP